MDDDEQLCFADVEDDEDEAEIRPELLQEYRHLYAQHREDRQQYEEEVLQSRARHSVATGPGRGRAAPRRAAGEPAQSQRRQRRRYTSSLADAAGSHSFGAVGEEAMDAAEVPQGLEAEDDVIDVQRFVAQLAAEAAAAAAETEPGFVSEGEEPSEWSQRSARAEAGWRQQAPLLGAAVLQAAAAPDPQQICSVCSTEQGCTVRYVWSQPVAYMFACGSSSQASTATQSIVRHVLSMHPTVILLCVCCLQVLVLLTSCRVCSAV